MCVARARTCVQYTLTKTIHKAFKKTSSVISTKSQLFLLTHDGLIFLTSPYLDFGSNCPFCLGRFFPSAALLVASEMATTPVSLCMSNSCIRLCLFMFACLSMTMSLGVCVTAFPLYFFFNKTVTFVVHKLIIPSATHSSASLLEHYNHNHNPITSCQFDIITMIITTSTALYHQRPHRHHQL